MNYKESISMIVPIINENSVIFVKENGLFYKYDNGDWVETELEDNMIDEE